jgi:uncharacterized membrane protein YjjP (DUF1212 family)
MPNPIFTFAFMVATMYGAAFHCLMGGGARRLALFVLTGWFGFMIGHYIGVVFDINLFNIGALRFAPATITTIVLLIFAHIFTSGRTRQVTRR